MQILLVDHPDAVTTASSTLRAGELVIIPTDTVYGLAALPEDAGAAQRIYLAKDRPPEVHLPVLAGSLDQVRQLGVDVSGAAERLAGRWWPGPLTMVFGFSSRTARPPWLAGRQEVAVRIPQHSYLLALLQRTGVLLVTSANRHGSATPSSAAEAAASLATPVSLVIDGGPLDGTPSTLVNLRRGGAIVERQGAISGDAIRAALEEAS
jgi:L-threonylcarbamoyladenylate synthase